MARKFTKEEISIMTPVEIWKAVYSGVMKRFPNGYFLGTEADRRIYEIMRYIIEEFMGWNEREMLDNFNTEFIKDYKLLGLQRTKNFSPFDFINIVYPGKYKPWQLKFTSNGFWNNEEHIRDAIRWLIEDILQWDKEDIKENMTKETVIDNGLEGLLTSDTVRGSAYRCIEIAYGNDYIKPWEMKCTSMSYWTKENCKKPLYWLIDEKGFSKIDLMFIDRKISKELGFYTAYATVFNENLVDFLNNAYPGEYKRVLSDIYHVPTGTKRNLPYASNNSGTTGVSRHRKKWTAYYFKNGKNILLGPFDNKEDAIKCRLDFEKKTLEEHNML